MFAGIGGECDDEQLSGAERDFDYIVVVQPEAFDSVLRQKSCGVFYRVSVIKNMIVAQRDCLDVYFLQQVKYLW